MKEVLTSIIYRMFINSKYSSYWLPLKFNEMLTSEYKAIVNEERSTEKEKVCDIVKNDGTCLTIVFTVSDTGFIKKIDIN